MSTHSARNDAPCARRSTGGRRPRQSPGQAGFTLIELVIAVTLVGLILALGFAGLRTGLRSWQSVAAATEAAADRRTVEGFLRRQIAQARPVARLDAGPGEPSLAFHGDAERVEFVAPLPQRDRIGGLYRFTLTVREADAGMALHLDYQLHLPDVAPADEGEQTRVLLSGLTDAVFTYFGAPQPDAVADWRETWIGATDLPRLVRLRATAPGAAEEAAAIDIVIPIWASTGQSSPAGATGVPRG